MKKTNSLSIITLVVSIVALITSCCGGGVLGFVACVLGIISLVKNGKQTASIIGIVLSLISCVITLAGMAIFIVSFSFGAISKTDHSADTIFISDGYIDTTEDEVEDNGYDEIKVGDVISLGEYEQDNDFSNGKEPIDWVVVKNENGRTLLLSQKVLDIGLYASGEHTPSSWESSSLRTRLNLGFFYSAFSPEERNRIQPICLDGNSREDYVFVLNMDEVYELFPEEEDRVGEPSFFVRNSGIKVSDNGGCCWVLRSDSFSYGMQENVYCVSSDGVFSNTTQNFEYTGIRPAIWVLSNEDIQEMENEDIYVYQYGLEFFANDDVYMQQLDYYYGLADEYRRSTKIGTVIIGEQIIVKHLYDDEMEICIYDDDSVCVYGFARYNGEEEKNEIIRNINEVSESFDDMSMKKIASGSLEETEVNTWASEVYYIHDMYVNEPAKTFIDDVKYYLDETDETDWIIYYW